MSEEHEHKDMVDRLSAPTPPSQDAPDTADDFAFDDLPTPIPVRVESRDAAEEALRRAEEEARQGRDVVREYQEKYYGTGRTAQQRAQAERLAAARPPKANAWKIESVPVADLSEDERLWAALAHGSTLVTLGIGLITGGWGALVMIFAPLAIYFAFRERSNFVAFHALQAFALQLVGTVGWVMLLVTGVTVLVIAIVISAIASVVIIGIPFVILFALLLVVFVLLMLVAPFALLVLSIIGAIQTYNGHDYRYPYIARWIDQQLSGGFLAAIL